MPRQFSAGCGTAAASKRVAAIHNWQLGKTLGSGAYAEVRAAHKVHDPSKMAAIKIIDVAALSKRGRKSKEQVTTQVVREIASMRQLRHRNVVELYDVAFHGDQIYMIMEYAAGGDMYDLIKDGGALSEADARFYFRQLVSALEYCHSHFVVHRDLKLENLLLSESKERVMLADFGLSNRLVPGKPFETLCGSSQYAAPEVLCGGSYLGLASDVWSLGVVLYTFLMGSLPFAHCGNNFRDVARAAMTQDFDLEPFLSQDCQDLLLRMLDPNADTRMNIQQIREHPWVNIGYSRPPDCMLPTYPVVHGTPKPDVVAKLVYCGFKPLDLVHKLKTSQEPCAELTMYHQLLQREAKERRSQSTNDTFEAMQTVKTTPRSKSLYNLASICESHLSASEPISNANKAAAATNSKSWISKLKHSVLGRQHLSRSSSPSAARRKKSS